MCDGWIRIAFNSLNKKNIQKSPVFINQFVLLVLLKKEFPFNYISSQHFEKIFRDAPIVLSLTKKQSLMKMLINFFKIKLSILQYL